MNVLKMQVFRQHDVLFRYVCNILRTQRILPTISHYSTTVDAFDIFDSDLLLRQREKLNNKHFMIPERNSQYFVKPDSKTRDITTLNDEELDKLIQDLAVKNKDKQIESVITECLSLRRHISDSTLKMLLKHFSNVGKPDMIALLQKYSSKTVPNVFRRNGEFSHYLAKAQCMKGNSEKGLSMLIESYKKNENLRSFYRIILRELIHDSVLNRSEASLVVFKKYVLEFSSAHEEHYPLVCFWHVCWLSSWYSDQMLANELWDDSKDLREIVAEKVTALSISALKSDYNEDAVVRLLQTLLKYQLMDDYAKVLQVLFSYKLKNRDLRGCSEILRNCEILGISLPSDQQGKYIKMLIYGSSNLKQQPKAPSKEFKLKF